MERDWCFRSSHFGDLRKGYQIVGARLPMGTSGIRTVRPKDDRFRPLRAFGPDGRFNITAAARCWLRLVEIVRDPWRPVRRDDGSRCQHVQTAWTGTIVDYLMLLWVGLLLLCAFTVAAWCRVCWTARTACLNQFGELGALGVSMMTGLYKVAVHRSGPPPLTTRQDEIPFVSASLPLIHFRKIRH